MDKKSILVVIILMFALIFIVLAFFNTIFTLFFILFWLILTIIAGIIIFIDALNDENDKCDKNKTIKIFYVRNKKERYTTDITLSKNFKKVGNDYVERQRRKHKRK